MVNKYPSVHCPVTKSTCSSCFKNCERIQRVNNAINAAIVTHDRDGISTPFKRRCPITDAVCSLTDCVKECTVARLGSRNPASAEFERLKAEEANCSDGPHRDDEKIFGILVKAIDEFNSRCDNAATKALLLMPSPPQSIPSKIIQQMITAGIFIEMKNEFAASIVKALHDEGFAIGSFR